MLKRTVIVLSLLSSFAFAEDARKIDFTVTIVDGDGIVVTVCADRPPPPDESSCKAHQPLTLGAVAMRALALREDNISADESLKRGQLALNVYHSSAAALTADEISLIKRRIAAVYSPLIVARTFAILDPASIK